MNEGESFSKELVAEAHDEVYELNGDRKKASTYGGKNLRSGAFLAALDLEAPEAKNVLKEALWNWLLNYEESPDLAKTAAKILANATFGEKVSHYVFNEGEFADKSTERSAKPMGTISPRAIAATHSSEQCWIRTPGRSERAVEEVATAWTKALSKTTNVGVVVTGGFPWQRQCSSPAGLASLGTDSVLGERPEDLQRLLLHQRSRRLRLPPNSQ